MTKENKQQNHRRTLILVLSALILILLAILFILYMQKREAVEETGLQISTIEYEETEAAPDNMVPDPGIDVQLLTINPYSRPGIPTDPIEAIVIHYLGNPGTTAQQNHDYFESLKDLQNAYMSSNFIVGLEGEIIQNVPTSEVAYASNGANHNTVSIECCHPDETGKFNNSTYWSAVHSTAYLCEKFSLGREDIIGIMM